MELDLLKEIKPNRQKALFLAKRQLAEFVYDAVNLEGIHYTLPEVQTLLDGVTVGGHKLSDQRIALNQADAWHYLFQNIQNNTFSLEQSFVCQLHFEAAKEEALSWGEFRTGQVTISGTDYMPPKADVLADLWQKIIFDYHNSEGLVLYQQAIGLFLDMARIQFFYDVNKRMGRFMMNGILLDRGYPAINLPVKHQLEFNTLMLDFYQTGNKTAMTAFMLSCLDNKLIEIMSE
ncbi:Fic family protein [Cysteiniphilum sp. 6C5]|uniref:Fic family protein n=1 Tax=unclassified Cysteiniphilum TaxID=2610889 RepID=UPI003F86D284